MPQSFRRIVTGEDKSGKSILVDDRRLGEGEGGDVNLWMTGPGAPAQFFDGSQPLPFMPKAGGTIFRIVRIPPPPPGLSKEEVKKMSDGFFAHFGIEECRVDTSRDAFMHKTPTIDYTIILSGEVSLLLDTGDPIPLKPMDTVVQGGANHSWLVTGKEPAVFLAVLTRAG